MQVGRIFLVKLISVFPVPIDFFLCRVADFPNLGSLRVLIHVLSIDKDITRRYSSMPDYLSC